MWVPFFLNIASINSWKWNAAQISVKSELHINLDSRSFYAEIQLLQWLGKKSGIELPKWCKDIETKIESDLSLF